MEVSPSNYHFAGWATRSNVKCSDGRTIMPDAFKHQDGAIVPLVWNHQHSDVNNVLGKALLHSRDGDLYAYCLFNDTESGQAAKQLVQHGDVCSLSICANQLKHTPLRQVTHGIIREVSLVLAGANPRASIDSVILHGEEREDEGIIYTGEEIELFHAEDNKEIAKEDEEMAENSEKTVKEVWDGLMKKLDEDEQNVIYAMIGQAAEDGVGNDEEEDEEEMKHNVFDNEEMVDDGVLTHADQVNIISMAKSSAVGSLKAAMALYAEENQLQHGWERIGDLFPDYKDVHPGAPELIERDMTWVSSVMRKAHKSPISRIRTRQADARATDLRAKGYNNREIEKRLGGSLTLLMRTTDPQTVYVRDELHRDDINDITDFDVVAYQKNVMKHNYEEVVALAALVGDGREDTDPDKIHENHIRPIWKDEELYTIHYDIDTEGTLAELQGTNTNANFGKNYVRCEAMVNAALYSREEYKGKGSVDMYIDPHELNVMLLARDLNGRRIYDSRADLAKALNVDEIHTVEQFKGLTRTTKEGKTKKLLALFVNMGNYQFGATKGGELTSFDDFDIDFNKYKYLMEGRLSGALVAIKSAIAIEEDVTDAE